MHAWYRRRALRRPYGKINIIGLLLIAGVVGLIYSVVVFSKVYLDNLDVKEQIASAYNQAWGMNDQAMKLWIEAHLSSVGEHDEEDSFGNLRTVSGLGLKDDNITIERNEVARSIMIRVDYSRKVILVPTTRVKWVSFHPSISGPIKPPG